MNLRSALLLPLTLPCLLLLASACSRDAADAPPAADTSDAAPPPSAPATPTPTDAPTRMPAPDMSQAKRFDSPQGYSILVAPGFTMTPEEPCCDQAWPEASPDSFMRIERIDVGTGLDRLRDDMALALSAVGPAKPANLPPPQDHEIELQLQATSGATRVLMSIHRVGHVRYRVTRHLRGGTREQTAAAMQAMLGTLEHADR